MLRPDQVSRCDLRYPTLRNAPYTFMERPLRVPNQLEPLKSILLRPFTWSLELCRGSALWGTHTLMLIYGLAQCPYVP
jgi:hypothetical protein